MLRASGVLRGSGQRRRRRRVGALTTAATVTALVLASAAWLLLPARENSAFERRLNAAETRGGVVDLAAVVGRRFDRVVFFPSYTSQRTVDAALGFSWHPRGVLPDAQDGENLTVVVVASRVVMFVKDSALTPLRVTTVTAADTIRLTKNLPHTIEGASTLGERLPARPPICARRRTRGPRDPPAP